MAGTALATVTGEQVKLTEGGKMETKGRMMTLPETLVFHATRISDLGYINEVLSAMYDDCGGLSQLSHVEFCEAAKKSAHRLYGKKLPTHRVSFTFAEEK